MRWLFLGVTVVLIELLTYGSARGLQWGLAPWLTSRAPNVILAGMFIISNALLVIALSRMNSASFKILMTWMALLWFFILASIATVLISLLIAKLTQQYAFLPWYGAWGSRLLLLVSFLGLVAMAVYNAYMPVERHITLTTTQPLAKPLRIAMVSDLHLGRLVGNQEIDRLTDIVKRNQVDMLLIPGDIMDDNTVEYQARYMQQHLATLVHILPLGVYATLGNHDMYGHEPEIRQALQEAGIKLLADNRVLVDNRVWLVGRLDNHAHYRKPTAALMPTKIDKPVILLDHEPSDIEKNVQLPIDVQLSGHTHNGQIFPANFIVKKLNALAYGHKKFNQTDVIVSSGYGFWGVPFRLGSQSEVWIIDLTAH